MPWNWVKYFHLFLHRIFKTVIICKYACKRLIQRFWQENLGSYFSLYKVQYSERMSSQWNLLPFLFLSHKSFKFPTPQYPLYYKSIYNAVHVYFLHTTSSLNNTMLYFELPLNQTGSSYNPRELASLFMSNRWAINFEAAKRRYKTGKIVLISQEEAAFTKGTSKLPSDPFQKPYLWMRQKPAISDGSTKVGGGGGLLWLTLTYRKARRGLLLLYFSLSPERSETSKKEEGEGSVSFRFWGGCFLKLLNLTNNFRRTLRMDNKRVFLAHARARHEAEKRARQKFFLIFTGWLLQNQGLLHSLEEVSESHINICLYNC